MNDIIFKNNLFRFNYVKIFDISYKVYMISALIILLITCITVVTKFIRHVTR